MIAESERERADRMRDLPLLDTTHGRRAGAPSRDLGMDCDAARPRRSPEEAHGHPSPPAPDSRHESNRAREYRELGALDRVGGRFFRERPRDLGMDLDTSRLPRRPITEEERARIRHFARILKNR